MIDMDEAEGDNSDGEKKNEAPESSTERCTSGIPAEYYCDVSCSNSQEEKWSLEERCLLELQMVGIHLGKSCTEEREDGEIIKAINELEKIYHEQVRKQRAYLCNLQKEVLNYKKEDRDLELIALERLVEIAYEKYMACSSGEVPEALKEKAIAFADRSLRRYQEYQESGKSCFNELMLSNIVSFAPRSSDVNFVETVEAKVAADTDTEAHAGHRQSGDDIVISTKDEQHSPHTHVKGLRKRKNPDEDVPQENDSAG